MNITIIVSLALLAFTVLMNVMHVPKAAKVTVQSVQINYPVSLSKGDGICYANAPNGVVTAFRVKDGVLIWLHVGRTASEESVTVVDGVIYLAPILPHGSPVTSMTVEALRARDGLSLWSRSLPTDSPETFQLTAVNKVVYVMSAAERIDALRASDGFPLWTYTSLNPPQSFPAVVAEGMVYLSLQDGSMDVLRADTGILLWRYTPRVPALQLFPLILVADGVAYASTQDGHLYALRAIDGFTIWSVALHANENLIPMNVIGGVLFMVASFSGSVEALRESSGSVIWQYPARAGESFPITVAQGVIYLALYTINTNKLASITALRASDGILIWSYTPHTTYKQLLPVAGYDIVLIAWQDGSVDALRASSGSLLWRRAMNS